MEVDYFDEREKQCIMQVYTHSEVLQDAAELRTMQCEPLPLSNECSL